MSDFTVFIHKSINTTNLGQCHDLHVMAGGVDHLLGRRSILETNTNGITGKSTTRYKWLQKSFLQIATKRYNQYVRIQTTYVSLQRHFISLSYEENQFLVTKTSCCRLYGQLWNHRHQSGLHCHHHCSPPQSGSNTGSAMPADGTEPGLPQIGATKKAINKNLPVFVNKF